ncbi:MAG: phenylalanine--tRNA ligase subunit alpha [Acidimicrobiia bacterium]|nr:phenylalanine--tRNA ligase subunit alpha [Acidimicrobiia bacterium]
MTIASITAEIDAATTSAVSLVAEAADLVALEEVRREVLGKRSVVAKIKVSIKSLPAQDRPEAGRLLSLYSESIEEALTARQAQLGGIEVSGVSVPDLSLGSHGLERGHLHLVTQVRRQLEDIFVGLGYKIAEGPEVEDDWHNFEALNIPPAHPARSMQDTLYVDLGAEEQFMLRTHTSPVQIRTMENQEPPIYVVAPGRTYRNETLDARHSPIFHQMECLAIDKNLTMADLFGTIETFARQLFDDDTVQTRFRSDFFPYTEPSAELAVSCVFCSGVGCRVCSHTGWIELGGCGMVDPAVLSAVGIDPEKWQGFAFGFGLERIAMIRYGIDEIRTFYDNDLRFLAQY